MKSQVADIVFTNKNKVLLVQQRKQSAFGLWSYPGGRVEENETLEEAIIREVKEELNTNINKLKPFKTYELTTSQGPLDINTFIGNIDGEISLNKDELIDYRWFSLEMLEKSKAALRSKIVLKQAKDVINQQVVGK